MLIFAFPGTGKTSLSRKNQRFVDLELSEIKYDNSSVSHLTKEERKAIRRPLACGNYRQVYVEKAMDFVQQGRLVLVALNLFPSLFWHLLWARKIDKSFQIIVPRARLAKEYIKRYQDRGNNRYFIFQVMLVWYPTTWLFGCLSKLFPDIITILKTGETLETILPVIMGKERSVGSVLIS